MTFRAYHRMNPCFVVIERGGVRTKDCEAFVLLSGADADLNARTARTTMSRVFVVRRLDSEWMPKRGDTLIAYEKDVETRYMIASDVGEPAVQFWKGNQGLLRIRCYQANKQGG